MKKYSILFAVIMSFSFYGVALAQESYYGKKIDDKDALAMSDLMNKIQNQKVMNDVKVTGTVNEVCQEMGCWMTLDKGDGTTMRVRMKGHSFFLPKDCAGKTAVIQGKASVEETTVEELKHYAEDAGKTKEQIKAIKEPKTELTFIAEGVILK